MGNVIQPSCPYCFSYGCAGTCLNAQGFLSSAGSNIVYTTTPVSGTTFNHIAYPPSTRTAEPEVYRKQLKLHMHFCKQFVSRYNNWRMEPDASSPFEKVYLVHPSKMLKLKDQFPMNELEITGLDTIEYDKLYPNNTTLPRLHLIRYPDFQLWAIGADELPDIIR